MGCWVKRALVLRFVFLGLPLMGQSTPRRPRGIYAVVNVEENIKKAQAANPSITTADLKNYFVDLYRDVLNNPFDGTPVAQNFGGTRGETPLNYLQIYAVDFQYADAHASAPVQVIEAGGASVTTSAQDLLNLTREKLLEIGEPPSGRP